MTMACEMRCPWYCRNERAQRVYLVLSRVACLAATRELPHALPSLRSALTKNFA